MRRVAEIHFRDSRTTKYNQICPICNAKSYMNNAGGRMNAYVQGSYYFCTSTKVEKQLENGEVNEVQNWLPF